MPYFDQYSTVLAALVAAVSVLERAEEMKCCPSKAVASDKMYRQMIEDYKKAIATGRDDFNKEV